MTFSDTLKTIYSHNLWANMQLFEQCAELTEEQLNATGEGVYGTILSLLQHITTSEQAYLSRISTGEQYQRPETPPTIEEMREMLQQTGEGFIEWAPKIKPGDSVVIDWDGTPRDVPKAIILTQVINHATEHREQIKTILTQLGIQPVDIQSWVYFDADAGIP